MLKQIKTIAEKVKAILKDFPETQDSDQLLYAMFIMEHLKLGLDDFKVLWRILLDKKTPPFESIRRVRQKIQEGGELIGTKRKHRQKEREKVYSFFAGQGKLF